MWQPAQIGIFLIERALRTVYIPCKAYPLLYIPRTARRLHQSRPSSNHTLKSSQSKMQISVFVLFALPLAVLGNPFSFVEASTEIEKRDAGKVYSAAKQINADGIAIHKTLNTFANDASPNGDQLGKLLDESDKLTSDFKKAINDAKSSGKFTESQSTNIYNLFEKTVYPDTQSLLAAFYHHYP